MTDSSGDTGGPWRIALVDDDATVLRSLSRMLTLCGYEVSTYSSADAFLSSLRDQVPEMLLVDLRIHRDRAVLHVARPRRQVDGVERQLGQVAVVDHLPSAVLLRLTGQSVSR